MPIRWNAAFVGGLTGLEDDEEVHLNLAHLCILVEFVSRNVVDGENEFDLVLLGLFNELLDLL